LHVKGHQDNDAPYDFLDLSSQLNVDANTLATQELQEFGSPKPIVPIDLAAGVQLNINGCMIHNQCHLAPICQSIDPG
jgi:hypothetical protein